MSPLYQRPHWLDYQWAIRYVVIKDAESHRKTHSKRWNQFPAVINLHSLILHNPVDSILILLHRTQTKNALTAKVTSVICLTVRSAKFNINQNAINSYKNRIRKYIIRKHPIFVKINLFWSIICPVLLLFCLSVINTLKQHLPFGPRCCNLMRLASL